MEFVAKPIPNTMDDSTPKNLATSFSSSSCLSRFPTRDNKYLNDATFPTQIKSHYYHKDP